MHLRRLATTPLLFLLPAALFAQAPTFQILPVESKIRFKVKSSVDLVGVFAKWDATIKFTSAKLESGSMEIRIDAASVDTGSGMKDKTLKGDDFFSVKKNPTITFVSTKFTQTGPKQIRIDGNFTIRGVSKPEALTFEVERDADGKGGTIVGTMAFDRKDYGMDHNIPFIKIADRVEVELAMKGKRTSGPPIMP